jgi:hypothetical protein
MRYAMLDLAEQRGAQLRRDASSGRRTAPRRGALREMAGRRLVRLGQRLAPATRTAAAS